jgi:hypothetical protein
VPAGIQAGDLIVLLDHAVNNPAPEDDQPSGFQRVLIYGYEFSVSGFESVLVLSYKLAVGNESNQTLTGMEMRAAAPRFSSYSGLIRRSRLLLRPLMPVAITRMGIQAQLRSIPVLPRRH